MEVAVLGAGTAGRGIAQVCALAGHEVALYDEEANVVMDGIDAVQAGIDDAAAAGEVPGGDAAAATDRIEGTTSLEPAVGDAEVVVETTDVDREARRALFAEVEELVGDDTLVATGEDILPVSVSESINPAVSQKSRLSVFCLSVVLSAP